MIVGWLNRQLSSVKSDKQMVGSGDDAAKACRSQGLAKAAIREGGGNEGKKSLH